MVQLAAMNEKHSPRSLPTARARPGPWAWVLGALGGLGLGAVPRARAGPLPKITALTPERISVLSAQPLHRFDTLVIRSPAGEDCGLLVLDTVEQRPEGWLGVGAQRSGTWARLDDAAVPVSENSPPGGAPCRSREPAPAAASAPLGPVGPVGTATPATSASPPRPRWAGVHRAYVRARPYVGFHRYGLDGHAESTSGVIADLGAEANTASGFKIGFEIAPLKYIYERPQMSARLHLGYANEVFALSLGIGNGLSWYYPQLGPIVRLGRLDGTFATVRISWAVYPPRPIPMDLDVDINVRTSRRTRWNLNLGGGYGNLIGVYATTGAQLLLGGTGLRGTTVLSAGLGVAWVIYDLGPALSLGIEQRF